MPSFHVKLSTQDIFNQKPPRNLSNKNRAKNLLSLTQFGAPLPNLGMSNSRFWKKHLFQLISIIERSKKHPHSPICEIWAKHHTHYLFDPALPLAIKLGRLYGIIGDSIHILTTSTAATWVSNHHLFSGILYNFSSCLKRLLILIVNNFLRLFSNKWINSFTFSDCHIVEPWQSDKLWRLIWEFVKRINIFRLKVIDLCELSTHFISYSCGNDWNT